MTSELEALLDNLTEKFHLIRTASLISAANNDDDFIEQIADEGVTIIDEFKKMASFPPCRAAKTTESN